MSRSVGGSLARWQVATFEIGSTACILGNMP
jgi:hypothetical protein